MDVNLVVLFGSFTPSYIALLFLTLRANSPHISLFNMLFLYYNWGLGISRDEGSMP